MRCTQNDVHLLYCNIKQIIFALGTTATSNLSTGKAATNASRPAARMNSQMHVSQVYVLFMHNFNLGIVEAILTVKTEAKSGYS